MTPSKNDQLAAVTAGIALTAGIEPKTPELEPRVAPKRKKEDPPSDPLMDFDLCNLTVAELHRLFAENEEDDIWTIDDFDIPEDTKTNDVTAPSKRLKESSETAKQTQPETPCALLVTLQHMRKLFIEEHQKQVACMERSAFLYPLQVRFRGIGFKCPFLDIPWKEPQFADPSFVVFADTIYFSKNCFFKKTNMEDKVSYYKNVVGILTGRWFSAPGEERLVKENVFYAMSSLSAKNMSEGLYLDVSGTMWEHLYSTLSNTKDKSNCEIISMVDNDLQCEVLLVSITRDVQIGEPLILAEPHRSEFQLNVRGHGRKLCWLSMPVRQF